MKPEKLYKTPKFYLITVVALFLIFLIALNFMNPMSSDDYPNSFLGGSNERMDSPFDILKNVYLLYLGWSGRFFSAFGIYLSLFLGKSIFNIINACVFIGLILLIFNFSKIRDYKDARNVNIILLIIFLCWFGIPNFGQTIMWLTGSAVYLWSTTLLLLYIFPYRYLFESESILKDNYMNLCLMMVVGFMSGGTLENVVPIILGLIFIFYFYLRKNKVSIPKWFYGGFFSLLIGFLVSILAPGNFYRLMIEKQRQVEVGTTSNYSMSGFLDNILLVIKEQKVIFIVLVVLCILLIFIKVKDKSIRMFDNSIILSVVFFVAGISSWLIMMFSPIFPVRTSFFGAIFLIISITLVVDKLYIPKLSKNAVINSIVLFMVVFLLLPSLFYVYKQYATLNTKANDRIEIINESKMSGNVDIKVPRYDLQSDRFFFPWDLSMDPNYAENMRVAAYYDVNSIKTYKGTRLKSSTVVEINFKNELNDDVYEVFYDVGRGFNERDSYGEFLSKSSDILDFSAPIPDKNVKNVRIKLGKSAESIRIKDIIIKNENKEYILNGEELKDNLNIVSDIDSVTIENGFIVMENSGDQPIFELSNISEILGMLNKKETVILNKK